MAELLDASKEDILAVLGLGDPTRGDIITVNATPDYVKLAIGPADNLLISDGTDIAYGKISNANLNSGVFANITGVGVQAQALDMGTTNKIVNLADPTLDQDAATKKFVDDHNWVLADITDVTITATNLNILDDGLNTTLHFHDSDRARANHTGTQLKSTISDFAHQADHQSGGSDALTGDLDATARTSVSKNSAADVGARRTLNFIEGSNVTLTIVDDAGGEEVDITITSTAGGGSPLTTKGDVFGFDTADARIPVGANNLVFMADSVEALGVKYALIANANIDAAAAIVLTKLQNIATDRLLGRETAASGVIEEISLNTTLELVTATTLQRAALTGDITASAGSNTTAIATGVIVDADINASGITTRSKLPSNIVYDDEANTYGAFLQSFVSATMRIPLSATPTMAVDGDFAIDTTITDFSMGLIKYFDGEEMAVIAVPIAELTTPADGDVISYNDTTDEFELVPQTGGAGEANLLASLGGGTVLTAAVPKSGVTLQTVSIATTAPITHSVTTDLLTFDINDLVDADLATGVFASITGVGVQSQALDMGTNDIVNVGDLTLSKTGSIRTLILERPEELAVNTVFGTIDWKSHNTVPVSVVFGSITVEANNKTFLSEQGVMKFTVLSGGTPQTKLTIDGSINGVVIDKLLEVKDTGTSAQLATNRNELGIALIGEILGRSFDGVSTANFIYTNIRSHVVNSGDGTEEGALDIVVAEAGLGAQGDARRYLACNAGESGLTEFFRNIDLKTNSILNAVINAPTIANFINATHDHLAAAGGGTITEASISDLGTLTALVADKLDVFAATTKAELESVISDVSNFAEADGDTYSGAHLFNAATMRIPLSATPTMAVDGDFAIDTTIADFDMGLIKYFDGEEMAVISVPIAQLTSPTDGDVISYNDSTNEFELVPQTGGAGEANLLASLGGGTVLTAAVPKSGVTLQTVSIASTAPINHSTTTDLMTFVLSGTTAEFDTALESENFAYVGANNTFTGANIIDNATGLTFNNQGAGGDPILFANDAGQNLDITGGLQVSGTVTFGTYVGQTSIVTLGTIATGTWEGTVVATGFIATTLTGKTLTTATIDADNNTITNIGSSEIKSEIITGLSTVTGIAGDFVMISDTTDSGNLKKVDVNDFFGGGGEFTAAWTADHNQGGSTFGLRDALFVDPTITTKKLQIDLVGMTAAVTATLDFNFTTAQTITFPDATDTLMGKATVDEMTNKSYDLGGTGNALTGSVAEFNTALQSDSFGTLAGSLTYTGTNTFSADTTFGAIIQGFSALNRTGAQTTDVINLLHDDKIAFENVAGDGNLTIGTPASDKDQIKLSSKDLILENDDGDTAGNIQMRAQKALADGATISTIRWGAFRAEGDETDQYGFILCKMESDASAGAEEGSIGIGGMDAGNGSVTWLEFNKASDGEAQFFLPINMGALDILTTGRFKENSINISPIGTHDIWIDVGAFNEVTSGALAARIIGTGDNRKATLEMPFVNAANEFAVTKVTLPENYDGGTFTIVVKWTTSVEGAGNVLWACAGVFVSDGDDLTAAATDYGTEVILAADTQGTVNFEEFTARSAAITPANTYVAGDSLWIRIQRRGGDGGDTFDQPAQLLGVTARVTTDAATAT